MTLFEKVIPDISEEINEKSVSGSLLSFVQERRFVNRKNTNNPLIPLKILNLVEYIMEYKLL